jgi:hypothetical protein
VTVRRNSRHRANDPVALAARLPDELRSFDRWYYPNDLTDYMASLSAFLFDGQRLTPMMNAAGLSAADWFRHMLNPAARS